VEGTRIVPKSFDGTIPNKCVTGPRLSSPADSRRQAFPLSSSFFHSPAFLALAEPVPRCFGLFRVMPWK